MAGLTHKKPLTGATVIVHTNALVHKCTDTKTNTECAQETNPQQIQIQGAISSYGASSSCTVIREGSRYQIG